MEDRCSRCGCTRFSYQDHGPHIGAYCKGCGHWVKWVAKDGMQERMHMGMQFHVTVESIPEGYVPTLAEIATSPDTGYRTLHITFENLADGIQYDAKIDVSKLFRVNSDD